MNPREEAQAVLEVAREDPQQAVARATALIPGSDDITRATAHFALGLAHRTLANGAESTQHLEEANRLAAPDGLLRGQILRSLAFNYAQAGDHAGADSTIEQSIRLLTGQEQDLSRLQRAFMLLMRGEHRSALPVLNDAVAGFAAAGDDEYLELTLYNRALVHMEFGEYEASQHDLERAYEIGIRLDHPVSAADAALHLSQVLGWCDDVPAAMRWHQRSVELRNAAGAANPVADTEHAFVLIQARLMHEAEQALRTSLPKLIAAGDNQAIAVAGRLLLADVLVERGDYAGASTQLDEAAAEAPTDSRWRFDIASARHRTRAASGELSPELLDAMLSTADEMERNGEVHAAAVERFRAVQVAVACREPEVVSALAATALRATRSGPLWLQIQAWSALAQARMAAGNARGAAAAVRAGMDRVERYRAGIGATDLRLHAADLGTTLATLGLQLAIGSGSVDRIFAWSERLRHNGMRRPAADSEVATALADLRRAATRLRSAPPTETAELSRQVRSTEAKVTALTRQQTGGAAEAAAIELSALTEALDGRTLVEFVATAGELAALVITDSRARLVRLGDTAGASTTIDHLRLAAERIARPTTSEASREAAIASATEAARTLHEALITPLAIASERVVLVPTGVLHSVPWSLVCELPTEVAPSATAWLRARHQHTRPGVSLIVQGPGLGHSGDEVDHVARLSAATITSTASVTIAQLPSARSAHFSCHARPRTDNPMFSSLVLDDGELTLYDIERLDEVPETIVLATCAGGGVVLASGDEVLSLAGSFLTMGSRTVLAPLFTVSDRATATVMQSLTSAVAAGSDPTAALLEMRRTANPAVAFTAASFSCFGTV